MTSVYYKFTEVGGNGGSLIFVMENMDDTWTRDYWSQGVVYQLSEWTTDQISTKKAMIITAYVKAGTGQPYATVALAKTAIETLLPNAITASNGFILQGGDWDGSAWVYNSAYPFEAGSASTGAPRVFVDSIKKIFKGGESYLDGEIMVTISAHTAINIGGV